MEKIPSFGPRAIVLLFVLAAAPLVIWALVSRDGGRSALQIQVQPGTPPELIASLVDTDLNVPTTSGGAPIVVLRCVDDRGSTVSSREHRFPFTDTDRGLEPPHVHQPLPPDGASAVESCRLEGTDPPLADEI